VSGGSFSGSELVFVMAGGNDAIVLLGAVGSGSITPDQAIGAMVTAADELIGLVKTQIEGKGAHYVVVNNLPDLAGSPLGRGNGAAVQQLATLMVVAFNSRLAAGLAGDPKVIPVDVYSLTHDQVGNPSRYGLTNTTTPACGPNPLDGSSLVCNKTNTLPGVDVSHYMFADTVHATPLENALVAQYVLDQMRRRGWL
jgi:phospholipase/lecithinase/hemolysin